MIGNKNIPATQLAVVSSLQEWERQTGVLRWTLERAVRIWREESTLRDHCPDLNTATLFTEFQSGQVKMDFGSLPDKLAHAWVTWDKASGVPANYFDKYIGWQIGQYRQHVARHRQMQQHPVFLGVDDEFCKHLLAMQRLHTSTVEQWQADRRLLVVADALSQLRQLGDTTAAVTVGQAGIRAPNPTAQLRSGPKLKFWAQRLSDVCARPKPIRARCLCSNTAAEKHHVGEAGVPAPQMSSSQSIDPPVRQAFSELSRHSRRIVRYIL